MKFNLYSKITLKFYFSHPRPQKKVYQKSISNDKTKFYIQQKSFLLQKLQFDPTRSPQNFSNPTKNRMKCHKKYLMDQLTMKNFRTMSIDIKSFCSH